MSDYAAPIMGVVGAIIGGAATGWVNPAGYQWGWAIGAALGPCTGPSIDPCAFGPRYAPEGQV